jgi:hypothetical protein
MDEILLNEVMSKISNLGVKIGIYSSLNYFERKNLQIASDEYYERAKSEYKILCILRYTKIHHSLSLEFHFYFFKNI